MQHNSSSSSTSPHQSRKDCINFGGHLRLTVDDLIDFTPELRPEAQSIIARHDYGPLFTPITARGTILLPGTVGGGNWAGAAVDPARGILYVPSYVPSHTRPTLIELAAPGFGVPAPLP